MVSFAGNVASAVSKWYNPDIFNVDNPEMMSGKRFGEKCRDSSFALFAEIRHVRQKMIRERKVAAITASGPIIVTLLSALLLS